MGDFSDRKQLEAWLRDQPRPVVVGLAARAAARVIPTLNRDTPRFTTLALATFRAIALARVVATYPTRANDLWATAEAAEFYTHTEAADANISTNTYSNVTYAAAAAANTANAYRENGAVLAAALVAEEAVAATVKAANAYGATAAAAAAAVNASNAAARSDPVNPGAALWPQNEAVRRPLPGLERSLPYLMDELWLRMKLSLLAREGEHWRVWTDWYDAWLAGAPWLPQLSARAREELEVAICLIPDADWKQAPAHVNGLIQGMIAKALAEAPSPELQKSDAVPSQGVAAITPVWRDGRLVQDDRPAAEGRPAILLQAALIGLRSTMRKIATDFDVWIAECRSSGRDPQIDHSPADYLVHVASLIADDPPALGGLFEILHAHESLKRMNALVSAEWPDSLRDRFVALGDLFEKAGRLSPEWRELKDEDDKPPQEAIAATPKMASEFIEILESAATSELVAPALIERLKSLVAPLAKAVAAERPEPFGPDMELLALDVVNGVNNIAKRLAEAGVEIKKLGVKGAKEGWTGFRVNFPKQTKKLGAALAKLAVWGPLLGGGGWLAAQFEWFAPIWALIKPFLK